MTQERNVFLIILRLDLEAPNPLAGPDLSAAGPSAYMTKGHHSILAGVLDPGRSQTNTPLAHIMMGAQNRKHYNWILDRMTEILREFERADRGGTLLHRDRLAAFDETIDQIGTKILALLQDESGDMPSAALATALDDLLRGHEVSGPHVTIITNDFAIPWYWMRRLGARSPLCECRPLGMLQLSGRAIRDALLPDLGETAVPTDVITPASAPARRALLLGGGLADLPFLTDELSELVTAIEGDVNQRKFRRPFEVDRIVTQDELFSLCGTRSAHERHSLYRILHWCGHWGFSGGHLQLNGKPLEIGFLADFIRDAVLALDGCHSSRQLSPWSDLKGATAQMLAHGALGCVVSVLPLRNDPVTGRVFWGAFYQKLLSGSGATVGQAVLEARSALTTALEDWRLENVAPLAYQLVGNPSARLFEEASV